MPRLITLIVALLMGCLFSQAPEFQQQYRQRLGGALDEVTREVERFAADARSSGLSVDAAIARLKANADEIARRRGQAAEDTIARQERLQRQQEIFADATIVGRLTALVVDLDPTLAAGTWATFRPAVPTTLDGLAAGLFGAGIGLFGIAILTIFVRALRPRRARGNSGMA
ncbi:MAG: DUF2937 family protein [Ancalomicrobiaceae bacterium]|nr:DUF2937 family protein [Ancalomicrobiaceae bacterium]